MEKKIIGLKKQLVMILVMSVLVFSFVTGCSSETQPAEQKKEKQAVSEEEATEKPQDNTGSSLTEPGVMRDITAQQLVDEIHWDGTWGIRWMSARQTGMGTAR